jgi:hypothetical protein
VSLLWAKRGWLTPGSQTLRTLERFGATDAWDFVDNSYTRAGVVTTNPGLTVTRASEGYAQREDGIWVNFASGALRRTDKGMLVEGARTNRALHSRDLTQAAWAATNVTVARNQVGIDGLANSACSLTATAGNGTVLQAVTDGSKARYFSVWIKRITGTGTVEVTLDNGSTWTAVTVTSAYTRVGATQTLANPTVGVRLVTDTDAVAVDFAQLEDAAYPSSPIATAGSSATRAADVVTASVTSVASPLTGFAEFAYAGAASDLSNQNNRNHLQIGPDGTNRLLFYNVGFAGGNGQFVQVSNATQSNITLNGPVAVDVVQKVASVAATDDFRFAANGVLGSADTSGTGLSALTSLRFGQDMFGYLRRAAVIPSALTDAQLQGITT